MNHTEDMRIRKILLEVQNGQDINKAVMQLKVIMGGLRLDTDKIDLQCFNCGKMIRPFNGDKEMGIVFEDGYPDSVAGPGEPAVAYSVCHNCMEEP